MPAARRNRKGARLKEPGEYLTTFINVPMTKDFQDEVYEAASGEGRTMASWGRQAFKEKLERDRGKR